MSTGRVAFRAITLAVLAGAAVLGAMLMRDAVAPAEAMSPVAISQDTSAGGAVGARVRLEALGTYRDGVTGKPRSGRIDIQTVGTIAIRYLGAGNDADPSVCWARFSDTQPDRLLVWRLESKLVELSGDRSTLQVRWTRSRAGSSFPERDDVRTITLGPGDTHVLDFVEDPVELKTGCASLIVRIAADPILPEVSQPVTADLWTVDETAPGGVRSVHAQVSGVTGDSLGYQLPPLDIAGGAASTSGRAVKLNLGGTLQAALAPDGCVDVTLTTVRKTVSGKATIQGEGRVQFRTKIGETAAVLLPEQVGQLPLPGGEGPVDLGRLLAGHRLSLYVKVLVAQ